MSSKEFKIPFDIKEFWDNMIELSKKHEKKPRYVNAFFCSEELKEEIKKWLDKDNCYTNCFGQKTYYDFNPPKYFNE